jgi:Holliday junction resolvase RusA-like endonuclease
MIRATVYGEAKPEGALAIGRRRDGRRYLHHRDSSSLNAWRRAIAREFGPRIKELEGAVGVVATFYVARPKGHYGTGRNAGQLRKSAPAYPTTRSGGDVDKLARAVLDALAGVAYRDDSQVTSLYLRKCYAEGPIRAEIGVGRISA